jgi:predicted ribosome quality control (RQC) complex YloA/Tae2 family protein
VSNAIRYDALLARDLAAELHARLRGASIEAILFDRALLRVALLVRSPRRHNQPSASLLWQLHPQSGHVTSIDRALATGSPVPLRPLSTLVRIGSPPDERIIELELDAGDAAPGAIRRLVIELVTNQWNALAIGADHRIVAVLRERTAHGRVLRPGAAYIAPAPSGRAWARERPPANEWARLLGAEPPERRLNALVRHAAYTSPLNAATIVGAADLSYDTDALERARERYLAIVYDAPREPVLLAVSAHAQPYSIRLAAEDTGVPTLLAAFQQAAQQAAALPAVPAAADVALAAVSERIAQLEQRAQRLHAEQAGAHEAAQRLRWQADLLLSQLDRVERGATRAVLDDFDGGTVVVELDPTVGAAENATRLYDAARKRSRAAERIPALLHAGERELTRLREVMERIRSGTASAAELATLAMRARQSERGAAARPLPYRTYRTSSGQEVRVGRSARANDELTFHHSSPTDVWLHARAVAGAHVILRWPRADQNPPARDIAEAAVLAALHSGARTSRTVAVDWTRRRYVRKPRKAAPGVVVPERVRTVFVEPDRTVEERLRAAEI